MSYLLFFILALFSSSGFRQCSAWLKPSSSLSLFPSLLHHQPSTSLQRKYLDHFPTRLNMISDVSRPTNLAFPAVLLVLPSQHFDTHSSYLQQLLQSIHYHDVKIVNDGSGMGLDDMWLPGAVYLLSAGTSSVLPPDHHKVRPTLFSSSNR